MGKRTLGVKRPIFNLLTVAMCLPAFPLPSLYLMLKAPLHSPHDNEVTKVSRNRIETKVICDINEWRAFEFSMKPFCVTKCSLEVPVIINMSHFVLKRVFSAFVTSEGQGNPSKSLLD